MSLVLDVLVLGQALGAADMADWVMEEIKLSNVLLHFDCCHNCGITAEGGIDG